MLIPLSCRSITSQLQNVETVIAQAQHYIIDGVNIAWLMRLARRVPVDISLAQKTGKYGSLKAFLYWNRCSNQSYFSGLAEKSSFDNQSANIFER